MIPARAFALTGPENTVGKMTLYGKHWTNSG